MFFGVWVMFSEEVTKLIEALKEPYKISSEKIYYQSPGPKKENYKTFCGT